ncbi:VOC family protein [Fulvivirgaceae bacterium BMA12]|uniref:VOC family protein n=1 Tax=Agaribacillus aureus TaxID=3051825 RepID=A0ABT8L083_9BACT|nr:VOC family protein [Fulvivirgaceae bacterium BMA12]
MKVAEKYLPAGLLLAVLILSAFGLTKYESSEFSSPTIQIGVVVKNLEASVKFYTEVIGMKKTGGFSIDKDFGKRLGLTDTKAVEVSVLQLEDRESATQWKLMSFNQEASHPKQSYIHDDTGVQYITIYVKSLAPVMERLKKHNIKLLGETPLLLPDGKMFVLVQDPDGIFVELIGPK